VRTARGGPVPYLAALADSAGPAMPVGVTSGGIVAFVVLGAGSHRLETEPLVGPPAPLVPLAILPPESKPLSRPPHPLIASPGSREANTPLPPGFP
jgi:hypothetical protein